MAKLYKVNEGKMLFGVCTGLGATGGASVTTWRIVFAVSSLFLFFPIVIYFVMGVALPVAKKKNDISKIEESTFEKMRVPTTRIQCNCHFVFALTDLKQQ